MTPLDHATRQWLFEGCVTVANYSGDTTRDQYALLDEVNRCRALGDLPPLPAPDHWPNRGGDYL